MEKLWFFTLKLLVDAKLVLFLFLNSHFSNQNWNTERRALWVMRATQTRCRDCCGQSCCLFSPHRTTFFPNPFDLYLAGPCGLTIIAIRACFCSRLLLSSSDLTSFYSRKESRWSLHLENCRKLVPPGTFRISPRWFSIWTSTKWTFQRCCHVCWGQGSHNDRDDPHPRACLAPADLQQHPRFRSWVSTTQIIPPVKLK